jgi:hypothetical protein
VAGRKPKYTINGEAVPSVTSIIDLYGDKYGLMKWYGEKGWIECSRVKYESAKFGSEVHKLVEDYLRGTSTTTIDATVRSHVCASNIINWCKETKLVPIAMEPELISEKHMYVGHCDAIVTFGDSKVPFILDWKTSSRIDIIYALQLAGYAQAYFEMTGIIIDDAAIVRVEKDPNKMPQFETKEFHQLFTKYVPLFLHLRELYDFYKSKGEFKKAK